MITPRSVVLAALLVAAIAPPASAQELVVGIFGWQIWLNWPSRGRANIDKQPELQATLTAVDFKRLDAPRNSRLHHAFRQAMLLHGVDVWGLSGMTSMAHTDADVDQTVAAVDGTVDLLKQGGIV